MKNKLALLVCFMILCSHDMYLKMDTFFLTANEKSTINLYNGTFAKSENTIDRDRMIDVSLTGHGERTTMREDQWTVQDSITTLHFTAGDPGTWVAGVSTKPRSIEMDGAAFNKYLKHDGILDMLALRQEQGLLEVGAVEMYSKHVKAIFQVGDVQTNDWSTQLGYPIEFVPQSNPYSLQTGDTLKVQLLKNGKPLANELVYADYTPSSNSHSHNDNAGHSHESTDAPSNDRNSDHSHNDTLSHAHEDKSTHHQSHTESHTHTNDDAHDHDKELSHAHDTKHQDHHHPEETHAHANDNAHDQELDNDHQHTRGQQLRTDENGIASVRLTGDGFWFIRTINLVFSGEGAIHTHESNWATLTFEVTHGHEHSDGDEHSHTDDNGIPSYVFWIGSLVILGGLFFFFSKKK